ncbi:MAG: hypothetical protein AUJ72_01895 [Candidatus Omnitrophica bacterium CG1_02_46_14]|nr:MAG: hypothetical protein AUJ72_01895 [Candidatus Omnitrophica bacterium CG1_02_46_14]
MKVLVHLNHGIDKSYMLDFGNKIRRGDIKKALCLGQSDAAQVIFGYANILGSVQKIELMRSETRKAEIDADFVVG